MSNPLAVTGVTALLIALSAFFVAAEFALLAARRHRLEERAEHSVSARAAVRSFDELTVLLAGCQLGITACALALGAITKPAVKYGLTPLIEVTGVPDWVADASAFALALVIVTFLHLVVGEMAPKSWAIAHPETAAIALALPMRGFMFLTRPLLRLLNASANWCLRRVGVDPRDTVATGQDAAALRQLVEHSADVGALEPAYSAQIADALDLDRLTLADLVLTERPVASVDAGDDLEAVRRVARASGHLRVLVRQGGRLTAVAHVRDTLAVASSTTAITVARPLLVLDGSTPVPTAVTTMRETRNHLVLVTTTDGQGVVTLTDVLLRLFPRVPA